MAYFHPSVDSPLTPRDRRLLPIPFRHVTIDDIFWAQRIRRNRERTLPHIYQLLQETGRIDALRLTWKAGDVPVPHIFWDSDVGKWIEAASYSLATSPDPTLKQQVDEAIDLLAQAQHDDGYLNAYFTVVEPGARWTNLRDKHELYCAGHLIEAAVAHYQATGERKLLDVLCRYADYIARTFGREPGQKPGYDGHEEIELALVKLYHATGDARYLALSRYFVDERGKQPHYFDLEAQERGEDPASFVMGTYAYNQAHLPVLEQTQVVGHAVRAMYLNSALADLAREQDDERLFAVCRRLWDHLTSTRMYLTGGIGTSGHNEGFTQDYDLPDETAYAETCAAIGLVFWAHRMLQLDCDRAYADVMERALYNGVLSGVSLDGDRFFYENPLASDGTVHRQRWLDVCCCPINLARLLPTLGQYIYSANATDLAVHLFVQGEAQFTIDGQEVTLHQRTRYPWEGAVALQFAAATPFTCNVRVRIPGWCHDARLAVNDETLDAGAIMQGGYAVISRHWQPEDTITLDLAMPVERIYAHPAVRANVGQVALQRGPIVYCLEEVDNGVPPWRLILPDESPIESVFEPETLEGVAILRGTALAPDDRDWADPPALYRASPPRLVPAPFTAIPYYAWDNRKPGVMNVWLHAR